MPDHHLHGNFRRCPACELRQEAYEAEYGHSPATDAIPCQICDGSGHVPLSEAEIVAATVEEARRLHRKTLNA